MTSDILVLFYDAEVAQLHLLHVHLACRVIIVCGVRVGILGVQWTWLRPLQTPAGQATWAGGIPFAWRRHFVAGATPARDQLSPTAAAAPANSQQQQHPQRYSTPTWAASSRYREVSVSSCLLARCLS